MSVLIQRCLCWVGVGLGLDEEPDTGPFFMFEPPSNILIRSQVGANISCSAYGKPSPTLWWVRPDGERVTNIPGGVLL